MRWHVGLGLLNGCLKVIVIRIWMTAWRNTTGHGVSAMHKANNSKYEGPVVAVCDWWIDCKVTQIWGSHDQWGRCLQSLTSNEGTRQPNSSICKWSQWELSKETLKENILFPLCMGTCVPTPILDHSVNVGLCLRASCLWTKLLKAQARGVYVADPWNNLQEALESTDLPISYFKWPWSIENHWRKWNKSYLITGSIANCKITENIKTRDMCSVVINTGSATVCAASDAKLTAQTRQSIQGSGVKYVRNNSLICGLFGPQRSKKTVDLRCFEMRLFCCQLELCTGIFQDCVDWKFRSTQ